MRVPDEYMNLTAQEASELGYVSRVARPRRTNRTRPHGRVPALFLILVIGTLVALGLHSTATSVRTQAAASTIRSMSGARGNDSSRVEAKVPAHRPGQRSGGTSRKYLLGWSYAKASSTIDLHDAHHVIATIPAGTKFLYSWQTVNGWTFLITCDAGAWGWARLEAKELQWTIMHPMFEKALTRLRRFERYPNWRFRVAYTFQ